MQAEAILLSGDLTEVEIEEHFDGYRPQREWYEVIMQVGGRTLQQQVKAGQREVVVRL